MEVAPTTKMHIGYSEQKVLEAALALQKAGEDGLNGEELLGAIDRSPKDHGASYLVRALREHGFLVQQKELTNFILPDAPIRQGFWVRHKTFGVVRVQYERAGFPSVLVVKLGDAKIEGASIRVQRSDLSGT